MKKIGPILVLLLAGALYWFNTEKDPTSSSPEPDETQKVEDQAPVSNSSEGLSKNNEAIKDDFSGQFMTKYGAETERPRNDIEEVADMLRSFVSLVKTPDTLPLGENRELTAALMGNNPYRTRLLSPESQWLNEKRELVDRWGTALYFHGIDANRVGIRSAGLDKKMWTPDDLTSGEDANPLPE